MEHPTSDPVTALAEAAGRYLAARNSYMRVLRNRRSSRADAFAAMAEVRKSFTHLEEAWHTACPGARRVPW